MLISIEAYRTCDFPGGSGPPILLSRSVHEERFPLIALRQLLSLFDINLGLIGI